MSLIAHWRHWWRILKCRKVLAHFVHRDFRHGLPRHRHPIPRHLVVLADQVDLVGKAARLHSHVVTRVALVDPVAQPSVDRAAAKELLEDLVARGVAPHRRRLFVIDGSKALRAAINASVRGNVAIYPVDSRGLQAVAPGTALDAAMAPIIADILRAEPAAIRTQKRLIESWAEPKVTTDIHHSINAFAETFQTDTPNRRLRGFFSSRNKRPL